MDTIIVNISWPFSSLPTILSVQVFPNFLRDLKLCCASISIIYSFSNPCLFVSLNVTILTSCLPRLLCLCDNLTHCKLVCSQILSSSTESFSLCKMFMKNGLLAHRFKLEFYIGDYLLGDTSQILAVRNLTLVPLRVFHNPDPLAYTSRIMRSWLLRSRVLVCLKTNILF